MEGINGFVTAWHALATKSHCHVLRLVFYLHLTALSKCAGGRPFGRLQRNICRFLPEALAALASATQKHFDWADLNGMAVLSYDFGDGVVASWLVSGWSSLCLSADWGYCVVFWARHLRQDSASLLLEPHPGGSSNTPRCFML